MESPATQQSREYVKQQETQREKNISDRKIAQLQRALKKLDDRLKLVESELFDE